MLPGFIGLSKCSGFGNLFRVHATTLCPELVQLIEAFHRHVIYVARQHTSDMERVLVEISSGCTMPCSKHAEVKTMILAKCHPYQLHKNIHPEKDKQDTWFQGTIWTDQLSKSSGICIHQCSHMVPVCTTKERLRQIAFLLTWQLGPCTSRHHQG